MPIFVINYIIYILNVHQQIYLVNVNNKSVVFGVQRVMLCSVEGGRGSPPIDTHPLTVPA